MQYKWGMLASAVALALSGAVSANQGGWEPTLGYGWQRFDDDRGLDRKSAELKYLGLGYYVTDEVMLELYGAEHDTESDIGSVSVDSSQLGMKALYHFETARPGLIPYVALGLNEIKFEADGAAEEDTETGIMFGLGVKTYFTERFSWRVELNSTRYEESHESDNQLWFGLSYLFGGSSSPAPVAESAEAEPVEEPASAPAPVPEAPKDSDGDGVLDNADQCPNTAAGRKVDEKGCEKVLREKVSIKMNVLFETARTDIKPESSAEIKRVADFMNDYPTTKVVIEGHTDSIGSNELNKSLSERRAKAVADALVRDYGIDAGRVSSVGYGEERPLADNNTAEGRAQNRRVTAEIEETVVVNQ